MSVLTGKPVVNPGGTAGTANSGGTAGSGTLTAAQKAQLTASNNNLWGGITNLGSSVVDLFSGFGGGSSGTYNGGDGSGTNNNGGTGNTGSFFSGLPGNNDPGSGYDPNNANGQTATQLGGTSVFDFSTPASDPIPSLPDAGTTTTDIFGWGTLPANNDSGSGY